MKTTTTSTGIGTNRLCGGGKGGGKKRLIDGAAPPPRPPSLLRDAKTASSTAADSLIFQLRDHVDQGRIFDARSVARELTTMIGASAGGSDVLDPDVRRLVAEVDTESEHVESLLRELHSDDGWTLAKRKSGVTVHFRRGNETKDDDANDNDSNIHVVRASTTFENFNPKDFVRFCSLFVETEYMHRWFPGGIMSPATVLSWHSKYSKDTIEN